MKFHVHRFVHFGMAEIFLLERGYMLFVNQRKPDIIEPFQQALAPERIESERIAQAFFVTDNLILEINR